MRTIIVTGSSQGVGLGIAKVFLDQGFQVFGADQKPGGEEHSSRSNYHHAIADLRERDGCAAVIEGCLARFGGIDVLVNNAGVGNGRPFVDRRRRLRAVLCDQRQTRSTAVPDGTAGAEEKPGCIVNIASAFGLVGVAGSAGYVPTKFAVVGITRMLATELGRDGIRVNAVAPGLIWSPATEARIKSDKWWHRMMIEQCPLGRTGQPEEIGLACAFLASAGASFVNGVVLPVDGGWSIAKFLPQPTDE